MNDNHNPSDFALSLSLGVFTKLKKNIDSEVVFEFARVLDEEEMKHHDVIDKLTREVENLEDEISEMKSELDPDDDWGN